LPLSTLRQVDKNNFIFGMNDYCRNLLIVPCQPRQRYCLMNRTLGFTMVELLITIVIVGILSSLALPAFQGLVAGVRVRSTAESFNQGLQLARSEAIKQNAYTYFRFSTTGRWEVCNLVSTDPTVTACPTANSVQIKHSKENSQNVVIVPTPTGTSTSTFTGMGRQYTDAASATNSPDGTAEFTQVDFSATGTTKTYRVVITSTGSSKLCDPSLAAGNVKACP
jgi:prepilin-type N-terminal cleavage/methylation domain-containing protein